MCRTAPTTGRPTSRANSCAPSSTRSCAARSLAKPGPRIRSPEFESWRAARSWALSGPFPPRKPTATNCDQSEKYLIRKMLPLYILCEIPLWITENRKVTGSTPVGATVRSSGFYGRSDFFVSSNSLAGREQVLLTSHRRELANSQLVRTRSGPHGSSPRNSPPQCSGDYPQLDR